LNLSVVESCGDPDSRQTKYIPVEIDAHRPVPLIFIEINNWSIVWWPDPSVRNAHDIQTVKTITHLIEEVPATSAPFARSAPITSDLAPSLSTSAATRTAASS
jgi:hypothetical protein